MLEAVVVEVEGRASPRDLRRRAGAERHIAVAVEVVAVGVRAGPTEEDLVVPTAEHLPEVPVVGLAPDLHEGGAGSAGAFQAPDDVAALVLDQVEVGGAVESVGAEDCEQVRKAGN